MATRSARDNKALNARHAELLKAMLRKPENKVCADCKRNDPRWASANLGCFMCIRCSGIHRSMGVHITRIKSIDLDTWTSEQVAYVQRWGNKRANAYWEAHLRPGHMPPDHKIESFIRSKYESKRWAMEGPLPEPETLDDESDETPPAPPSNDAPAPSTLLTKLNSPTAIPKPTALVSATNAIDLFDGPLSVSTERKLPIKQSDQGTSHTTTNSKSVNNSSATGSLFDLDFSSEASAAASVATAPAARKDVKHDILSLFAVKPQSHSGTLGQPTNVNMVNNQFNGLNLGPNSTTAPRVNNWNNINSLGDSASVWAAPTDQQQAHDPFGSFTSAPKVNTNQPTPDVFSDIWR